MKLKTIRFYNNEGEKMTSLYLLDDENVEIKQYSFYNKKDEIKAQKVLEESLTNLPYLLEEIYEMGKNGIPLEFSEKSIDISELGA